MKDQIYDKILTLEFMEFLRPEQKYNDSSELVAQIQKDINVTRDFFQER
jgi:FAD synthase